MTDYFKDIYSDYWLNTTLDEWYEPEGVIYENTADVIFTDTDDIEYVDSVDIASEETGETIDVDVTLPDLQITSYGGAYGEITLPNVKVTSYGGASLDATLPELTIYTPEFVRGYASHLTLPPLAITATSNIPDFVPGEYPYYVLTLPGLQLEAEFGQRLSLEEKLSVLSIEAYSGSNAELTLSELIITATGTETVATEEISCTLNSNLSPVTIEASSNTVIVTLDVSFPGILCTSVLASSTISLTKTLSNLQITASLYCNTFTLDAILPSIIMTPTAYGDDYGITQSIMLEEDRFHGELLRYNRWA